MTGIPFYLAGLAVAGLWARARPAAGVRRLLALWLLALLLMRVAPVLIALAVESGPIRIVIHLIAWTGAIVFLRVLLGLTARGRRWTRSRIVSFSLLAAGLLLAGVLRNGAPTLLAMLSIPWLLSLQWRRGLGVGGLVAASGIGLTSLVTCGVALGPDVALRREMVLPGLDRLWGTAIVLCLVYGPITMVASAARIHLSIRRIGRRLLISHLMSGLVPGTLAAVFLLLASALFLSMYRGLVAERLLASTAASARAQLARDLGEPIESSADPFGSRAPGQVVISRTDNEPLRLAGSAPAFPPDSLLALEESSNEAPLLWDGKTLYLRARVDSLLAGRTIRREALVPVDSLRMAAVSEILGIPVRVRTGVHVQRTGRGVSIGPSPESAGDAPAGLYSETGSEQNVPGSIGPQAPKGWMLPGGAVVSALIWSPNGGFRHVALPIASSAGLGEPILALFRLAPENPLAIVVLIVLALIAALFLAAVGVTVSMVFTMGRSITRSVAVLTGATAALREGRLEHRIAIEGQDELWQVAGSFNEMAEGLERMRSMELENERLEEELRVARRIQERLLPEAPPRLERLELAGLSLPAREVGGDYFDYIPLDGGRVAVAVADVSGKGVGAALLMSSFRASLRSQDLDRMGPGRASAILNRFVCASVDPGKFITAFLAILDPGRGEIRYVNAGHEPPILVLPDGGNVELDRGGLILGAFAQAEYEEGIADMPAGSLLALFTDGVTEARNPNGDFLGDEPVRKILSRSEDESCAQILRRIVTEIHAFAGEEPQSDDITLLLARMR